MVTEPLNMLAGDESSTDGIDMDLLREYKQKVVRMSDIELELNLMMILSSWLWRKWKLKSGWPDIPMLISIIWLFTPVLKK